ncbi:hypothetical protein AN936_00785 [Sphingopyxis macrogoltabida]|uniref:Uncharacterized protein n=1 Tax=Sphingopyxis macrogoltabida TaxID=33050 RepID=A0A0N9USX9_SPHMC|nr:hypothetical protein AN936_00785 [Sphingopyxis macrogoltabida]
MPIHHIELGGVVESCKFGLSSALNQSPLGHSASRQLSDNIPLQKFAHRDIDTLRDFWGSLRPIGNQHHIDVNDFGFQIALDANWAPEHVF